MSVQNSAIFGIASLVSARSSQVNHLNVLVIGLLDRVVHGVTAVEMMKACDEAAHKVLVEENPTNPQISISQVISYYSITFKIYCVSWILLFGVQNIQTVSPSNMMC